MTTVYLSIDMAMCMRIVRSYRSATGDDYVKEWQSMKRGTR